MSKKNIFAKFQDYVNKPKRNVFDLSFANNITTKFGQLTPVFCKECIPGDSFKIHSRFALQMMPMKFPVQTPMRAYLHFFYVRNRTLYKDWMDFIGGTKDNLTLPYVQPTDKEKFYRVGGLADYLGVPNVLYHSEASSENSESMSIIGANNTIVTGEDDSLSLSLTLATTKWVDYSFLHYLTDVAYQNIRTNSSAGSTALNALVSTTSDNITGTSAFSAFTNLDPNYLPNPWNVIQSYNTSMTSVRECYSIPWSYLGQFSGEPFVSGTSVRFKFKISTTNLSAGDIVSNEYMPVVSIVRDSNSIITSVIGNIVPCTALEDSATDGTVCYFDMSAVAPEGYSVEYYTIFPIERNWNTALTTITITPKLVSSYGVISEYGVVTDASFNIIGTGNFTSTPYDSDIHLNALPFRAYEAIYNSYYRNAQNNPYILNNVAEYNKYIPSYDGGADTNDYDLHQRNWEYDFLTSAVQTPQQGDIAPLVGISVTGEATFQDENGNTYYASAQYDSDGNITGWTSHSPNMPQGSLRLLMDMAGTGISINDLRNVNAFQKFLENNIRRGLKYRDQIKSHFGVDVRYDELDMPEFIGGCSTDINVNKLSQTSESGTTPLGSFVGQASAYGESKHDITHYCDEHGFIIGIMSIVPVPVYSQLLPKFFLKSEQLDYFFPEFGHIGYQPILQKEVSPLQTYYTNNDLNKVFGYQRSWYDYLDSTDEVHGQFRTTMRDFLMNRTFEDEPELSKDFLLVDPDQLNDVFLAGTDDDIYDAESDKIIGSLYFNVSKKSPIPLFGIPRLD